MIKFEDYEASVGMNYLATVNELDNHLVQFTVIMEPVALECDVSETVQLLFYVDEIPISSSLVTRRLLLDTPNYMYCSFTSRYAANQMLSFKLTSNGPGVIRFNRITIIAEKA